MPSRLGRPALRSRERVAARQLVGNLAFWSGASAAFVVVLMAVEHTWSRGLLVVAAPATAAVFALMLLRRTLARGTEQGPAT